MKKCAICLVISGFFPAAVPAVAGLDLGPEELVEADGEAIEIPGYSVPSYDFWDDDLEVPFFSGYEHVPSDGDTIDLPGDAVSRSFVCDWTGDGIPDLLIGGSDGLVGLYQGILPSGLPPEREPPNTYDV